MHQRIALGLAMLAGAALGATAIQGLHAQAKPPVYQITLQEVTNSEALVKEFVPLARALVRQDGGHLLASAAPVAIEGAAPTNRVVIVQWPSVEQMRKWYNSPEYQKAREIGNKYANFQIFAVEGRAQ